MQTFNLLIATPETTVFHDDIVAAIFPGTEGRFEILAHHAPIIAMVKTGYVEITDKQRKKHRISIQEGFFEFVHMKGTLLSYTLKS